MFFLLRFWVTAWSSHLRSSLLAFGKLIEFLLSPLWFFGLLSRSNSARISSSTFSMVISAWALDQKEITNNDSGWDRIRIYFFCLSSIETSCITSYASWELNILRCSSQSVLSMYTRESSLIRIFRIVFSSPAVYVDFKNSQTFISSLTLVITILDYTKLHLLAKDENNTAFCYNVCILLCSIFFGRVTTRVKFQTQQ